MTTQDLSDGAGMVDFETPSRTGSIGMVLLVALMLVAAAVGFLFIDHALSEAYVLILLAGLAVVGVFSLFAVAAGGCILFGFGMILFFATGQTVVQLDTADADRGKVMGVWAMMLSAGVPLGNLVLGPLADYLHDVRAVIAVQAVVISVAALCVLVRRTHSSSMSL